MTTKLHPERVARVLEKSIAAGHLDPAAAADAEAVVSLIDDGGSRGKIDTAVGALLASAWERGARAVARAESPKETRAAVAALRATAALSDALGVTTEPEAETPAESAPEIAAESAPDSDANWGAR